MRKVNTFEGGSDETTITTGNSGGSSGDAFDTVVTGTGVTNVFDTAQFMHGTLSNRQATGGTSAQAIDTWAYTGVARIFGRAYIRLSNVTTARSLIQIRASNAQRARIALTAGSKITLNNAANTVVATSSASVSVNTWYRLEYDIAVGTSASGTVNIYAGDSLTLTESIGGTSDFNTVNFDETRHGQIANATSLPDMWFDSLDTNDVGLPGPFLQTITPNAIASAETVYQPALSSTATITPNAIGSAAVVYQPALTSTASITPNAIASASTVYQPSLTSVATILASFIASAAQVYQPALASGAAAAKATSAALVAAGRTSVPAVSEGRTSVPAVSAGRTSTATVG